MTTNSPNQPNHPQQQNGYNPITLDDVQKPQQSRTPDFFADFNNPLLRWIAAPILGLIFLFSQQIREVAPLTILVLLGCLLSRLDSYPRQTAAAPLTLAAIKLCCQMASHLNVSSMRGSTGAEFSVDTGFNWLAMFFSICLIYIPKRESVTFKIILASSCLLLTSGLLPSLGFIAIFSLLSYTLFIAITAGIGVDLKTQLSGQVQGSLRPAL